MLLIMTTLQVSKMESTCELKASKSLMALLLLFASSELSLKDVGKVDRELDNYLALVTGGNRLAAAMLRKIAGIVGYLSEVMEKVSVDSL